MSWSSLDGATVGIGRDVGTYCLGWKILQHYISTEISKDTSWKCSGASKQLMNTVESPLSCVIADLQVR